MLNQGRGSKENSGFAKTLNPHPTATIMLRRACGATPIRGWRRMWRSIRRSVLYSRGVWIVRLVSRRRGIGRMRRR